MLISYFQYYTKSPDRKAGILNYNNLSVFFFFLFLCYNNIEKDCYLTNTNLSQVISY